jgi:DNA invertase Pin-like site-specific DNA recombinase
LAIRPFCLVSFSFASRLRTFKALGIDLVYLAEQVDTSTPTGKMVFTVLGTVAELDRSLIAERVHHPVIIYASVLDIWRSRSI